MPMPMYERHSPRHRFHRAALGTPFVVFVALYFLPWNPIYPGIAALFAGFYLIFLVALEAMAPGYIERVWNLPVLGGVMLCAFPVEELLFGLGIGAYWSGVYEHFAWHRSF